MSSECVCFCFYFKMCLFLFQAAASSHRLCSTKRLVLCFFPALQWWVPKFDPVAFYVITSYIQRGGSVRWSRLFRINLIGLKSWEFYGKKGLNRIYKSWCVAAVVFSLSLTRMEIEKLVQEIESKIVKAVWKKTTRGLIFTGSVLGHCPLSAPLDSALGGTETLRGPFVGFLTGTEFKY